MNKSKCYLKDYATAFKIASKARDKSKGRRMMAGDYLRITIEGHVVLDSYRRTAVVTITPENIMLISGKALGMVTGRLWHYTHMHLHRYKHGHLILTRNAGRQSVSTAPVFDTERGVRIDLTTDTVLDPIPRNYVAKDADKARAWKRQVREFTREFKVRARLGEFDRYNPEVTPFDYYAQRDAMSGWLSERGLASHHAPLCMMYVIQERAFDMAARLVLVRPLGGAWSGYRRTRDYGSMSWAQAVEAEVLRLYNNQRPTILKHLGINIVKSGEAA